MNAPSIVVTGANSHLGRMAVDVLRERTTQRVVAVASPRAELPKSDERVCWLRADLARPLDPELTAELARAGRVFHFAWTRTGTADAVSAANTAMLDHLFGALPQPARLWFVSSVSASPHALSTYGATKHAAAEFVRARGGSVLVCGLVVEPIPERGPYRMLARNVARFPLRFRAASHEPRVFPVRVADFRAALVHVALTELAPGSYRLFSPPIGFNAFIALLEELAPRRRLPAPFPAGLVLRATALAKRTHLVPVKLCDQILTFLYKDTQHLLGHAQLPGLEFRRCEDAAFFR